MKQADLQSQDILLDVRHLSKFFSVKKDMFGTKTEKVHSVNDVNFQIQRGKTLGLVGESGCGKTTLGRTLLRLIEPSEGQIIFDGCDITQFDKAAMRIIRKKMQIIFQDPYASLNPKMCINTILEEPLKIHQLHDTASQRRRRIYELLDYVQLSKDILSKYPHEFSGGQRQRICIARALAVEPAFIVCDEAVAALDVSIQAQVINLLMDLQKELQLTYLFISHDLRLVEFISDQVAVMYLGRIVERAPVDKLYKNTKHPYTKALLSAIPIPDPLHKKERMILDGDIPSPMQLPTGCYFHPRCWRKTDICITNYPNEETVGRDHHEEMTVGRDHLLCCHHPIDNNET